MAHASPSTSSKTYKPRDDELIQDFLYKKIHAEPVPNHLTILEYDLYGEKNPWEIWEAFEGSSYDGRDLYIFTTLKKKSLNGSRFLRIIGCGSWEAEDTGKKVVSEGINQCIGLKKRFRFEKSGTQHDGAWIMHEYSLDPSLQNNNSSTNNHVLCRFRKNGRHNNQPKQGLKRTLEEMKTVTREEETVVDTVSISTNTSAPLREDIHEGARNQQENGEKKKKKNKVVDTESDSIEQKDYWMKTFPSMLKEGQEHLIQREGEGIIIANQVNNDRLREMMIFGNTPSIPF